MHLIKSLVILTFIISSLFANTPNEKISLQLLWKHQFEFAGFYIAKEKGFYDAVGLDVELKEYQFDINIIDDVSTGKTTYGISYPTLILEQSKRKNLLLLKALLQSSPHVLIGLKKDDQNLSENLKNKKIMMNSNAAQSASFYSMLKAQNISMNDVGILNHSFDINDLLNGKTDLISCYTTNELYHLDKEHIAYEILDPKNYGFDFYNDLLFTSAEEYTKHPMRVKNFVDASLKGYQYAFEHIDETIDLILKKYNTQNKSKEALLYEAKELKKLAYLGNRQLGDVNKAKIQRIFDIYALMGLVKEQVNLDDFIYDDSTIIGKTLFTTQEKKFLSHHSTIKMCTNPDWEPIEFYNEQTHFPDGISIDTLKLLEQKSGNKIKFAYVKTDSWKQSQEFLKNKKCDILPSAIQTTKRESYANFTQPYLSYKLAIVTKTEQPFVDDIREVIKKPITRKTGSGLISKLKKSYPEVNIIETSSYLESIQMVAEGKAYSTITTLPVLSYYVNKYSINNLQVAGYTDMTYDLSIAVRKDASELLSILDKLLTQVTRQEHNKIYDEWANVKIVETFNYTYLWYFFVILIIVLTLLLYRQHILKQSLKQISEIIDATIEGIVISKNGECLDCNKSGLELFGYTKEEIIGKNFLELIAPEYKEQVKEKMRIKSIAPYEIKCLKKNGEKFYALVRGQDIPSLDLRISTAIDISELKALTNELENKVEEKTKQLQELNTTLEEKVASQVNELRHKDHLLMDHSKMAALGEMIGNIAHQWRQPLSIISTAATGIKLKKELGVDYDDAMLFQELDAIHENTQYLSQTIDTFRNFLKDKKEYKQIVVQDALNETINLINATMENNYIKLITNFDQIEPIAINTIGAEFSQVVINILNNAKDILRDEQIENPWIKIDLSYNDENVIISIEDNGGGIPQTAFSHIFEPYFTTKHQSQGTGLGLHMSYKIITESLHGKLYAQNTTNGAKFFIELPISS